MVATRATDRAIAREPRIEIKLPPQLDFRPRQRVVGGDEDIGLGLGELERCHLVPERREEQQHQARRTDDDAEEEKPDPEHDFLAGIEKPRRHVLPGEHAAALEQPGHVVCTRYVSSEVGEEHQRGREQEYRADEVVQVLREDGEPGKQGIAEHRQHDVLAEQQDQSADGQDDPADRDRPVYGPVPG